ncbi:MAG: 3-phosphoshikimate 1-carboxyvinyltransferase [Candidatus Omnitrophica bacterium]|nr:3-phosphoshikimate 1-carboxyvinyltransferase [Candidatus Omnitrophota bacterium]
MEKVIIKKLKGITGQVVVPADKSISHRSVILGAISRGRTEIHNFLESEDCLWTVDVFKRLGVEIETAKLSLIVKGRGLRGLKKAAGALYFGNSGTGLRLTAGVLSGSPFVSILTGDDSLSKRPMKRITMPLRQMGAVIAGKEDADYLPLEVKGRGLRAIDYQSPIASAQVKSSILLAGLYAEGTTTITEPFKSRDHTERMLSRFGADLKVEGLSISLRPGPELAADKVEIPSDISSASFFMVAAAILKNAELCLKGVGVNPTRIGIIEILKAMQADIQVTNISSDSFEPQADIIVKSKGLKPFKIDGNLIPRLIDEIPVLMVAATQADGESIIKDAAELRVKETDRINSMVRGLRKLGASVNVTGNDVIIKGPTVLKGNVVSSFGDHRTAMSMIIAGLAAEGETTVLDTACIKTSFPGFMEVIFKLKR